MQTSIDLILQHSISLPEKPNANIEYSFHPGSTRSVSKDVFVVFLNGLLGEQSLWYPVIEHLLRDEETTTILPPMLTYDRFGQGRTIARDPLEIGKEIGHGHNVQDAVSDLYALIHLVWSARRCGPTTSPRLVFVANSIGCAIARLYAETYSGAVAGLILLDSIMANSDFVGLWPDPDAADFDPVSALPDNVAVDHLRKARQQYRDRFHPSLANPEGLSRGDLAQLLPRADGPKLTGPEEISPLLTVVGHDPVHFANEGEERLGIPPQLTHRYVNRAWHSYNQDLLKIADTGRAKFIEARGCGHFIMRDDPMLVARLIIEMLGTLDK